MVIHAFNVSQSDQINSEPCSTNQDLSNWSNIYTMSSIRETDLTK